MLSRNEWNLLLYASVNILTANRLIKKPIEIKSSSNEGNVVALIRFKQIRMKMPKSKEYLIVAKSL